MCDIYDPQKSYEVCELIRQLGALYDKEKKQDMYDAGIKRERRHVSARLIAITAHLQQGHSPLSL